MPFFNFSSQIGHFSYFIDPAFLLIHFYLILWKWYHIILVFSRIARLYLLHDVSVKSINCVCACTNKQFILIDTPNNENGIKWCERAILWEFEVFEDCGIA